MRKGFLLLMLLVLAALMPFAARAEIFEEHYEIILNENALQVLADL